MHYTNRQARAHCSIWEEVHCMWITLYIILKGETRDRTRRDPHDLLQQFGFTHARSQHLADAVRALTNVTEIYPKR